MHIEIISAVLLPFIGTILGAAGVLYGSRSKIIAVQQAYPHQPLPNRRGPNIFATA